MVEDALPWPKVGGTYLEVLGCLGVGLEILLGREMDVSTVDAVEMGLETGLTLVLVNLNSTEGAVAMVTNLSRVVFSQNQ